MMSRSASYEMLFGLLTTQLATPLSIMKFMTLSQSTWDRVDPITYAPTCSRSPTRVARPIATCSCRLASVITR